MCNVYEKGKESACSPVFLESEAILELEQHSDRELIRRTDSAPVVTQMGEVKVMRWGFRRKELGVINNSRSDKLNGSMWERAYQAQRCLIPVKAYFEWKGASGQKQSYRFESPTQERLWMAGLWEESSEFGLCFSMITTVANRKVLPIHHRMPAILEGTAQERFLQGQEVSFEPSHDSLVYSKCDNPLVRQKEPPEQRELF